MQKKDIYKYMDLCMFYIIMFKKNKQNQQC